MGCFVFVKQKTAYEMRISDWRSDVCSSDLLSGAIGLGVKSDLMEELVRLSEEGSRTEIEKGRILLTAAEQLLREAAVADVTTLHRHGGGLATTLEPEDHARGGARGPRDVGQEYAADHIG